MSFKVAAIAVCTTCRKEAPGAFVVVEPQGFPVSERAGRPELVAPEFSFAPLPDWARVFGDVIETLCQNSDPRRKPK